MRMRDLVMVVVADVMMIVVVMMMMPHLVSRETSNIYDGSAFTADMAVQNCIGDAFRGATWVSLHNGGGVGWGEVSCFFLLLLCREFYIYMCASSLH